MGKTGSVIACLILTLAVRQGKAQEDLHYCFRHIDQSDGLLHNQALSIAQDARGFIWITTSNGLQRYDGIRLTNYSEMLTDPDGELTSTTEMIADKKKNLLWITNNIIVEKMDLKTRKFTVIDLQKSPNKGDFSFDTYLDDHCQPIMIGQNVVYKVDTAMRSLRLQNLNIVPPNSHKSSFIVSDSSDHLTWVSTGTKLYLVDPQKKKLYSVQNNPQHHPLLDSSVYRMAGSYFRFIMKDSRQNIWVSTWGDILLKYDALTHKIIRYSLSVIRGKEQLATDPDAIPLINCMMEDDNHNVWIGTEYAGLLRYNPRKDDFDYCIARERNSEGIRYNYKIFSIFQDEDRNLWIGTDKGINIFNPYRQYFQTLRHESGNPSSLPKNEIQCFFQAANGDMFVGTWGGGMAVFDSLFNFKKKIHTPTRSFTNYIWCFQEVDSNELFIGCQRGYLMRYNISSGRTWTTRPPEFEHSTIRCMSRDSVGNIWFGLHNGKIAEWNKITRRFIPYNNAADAENKIGSPVFDIYIDRDQHGWVGTGKGFKAFDLTARKYSQTWLPEASASNSFRGKNALCIEENNDSTLLIGTVFGGLNVFNKRSRTFSNISTENGLPSNTVRAIKKDPQGNFWFTSDYDIYRWNGKNMRTTAYKLEPGVINTWFASNRFYTLKNGQWVNFTATELIAFSPRARDWQDDAQHSVTITGFRLFDKRFFIDSLLEHHLPVRLSFRQNFFTIEFAGLNFGSSRQAAYLYRLDEADKDWVRDDGKGSASYTDLAPGTYHFMVRSENDSDQRHATQCTVVISPPFWDNAFFRIFELLLAGCLVYALVKWRIRVVKKGEKSRSDLTRRVAEMEMKALRSQMNPHFIFNCINSIDALIQGNDKYHATVYLNKFARLIRNILDSSKQNTVKLSKDVDTLKLYVELEQLRHRNKFTADIQMDRELFDDDCKVPSLIVQPFVENAILHGIRSRADNGGRLLVSVVKDDDYIKYTIEDNGIGRQVVKEEPMEDKVSYGTGLSNDRVKLFNNEKDASVKIIDLVENGIPSGTRVEIRLKIQWD